MFKKIPRQVMILGLVSFFNDLASEMVYPIVPIFLTTVLHTSLPIVGLIEGIAEGTASIMKFIFGYLSDRWQKRKPFVVWGYSLAAISKVLIGLAGAWPLVLLARFIDRTGKGLRTTPRDALLLENASKSNKGFIFGFHRSMDSAGAVAGPLVGLIFLTFLRENIRLTFFIAFIPAVVAVILLVIFVKEKHEHHAASQFHFRLRFKHLDKRFLFFLAVSLLFALGNSADAFLILRAQNLGVSISLTVLMYVVYNLSQTVFSTPAGQLADTIGAKRVYGLGLVIFAVVYFFFGFVQQSVWLWLLFGIYGVYIAFTDGVSKAYISEFITHEESGTYFGMYQAGIALAAFFASFVGGILWSALSPSATFYYGAIMALLAFLTLSAGRFTFLLRAH